MKSWKTTTAGLAMIFAGLASAFQCDFCAKSMAELAGAVMGGLGLIFARDNNVTSEAAGAVNPVAIAPPNTHSGSDKLLFFLVLGFSSLFLMSGCARFSTRQTDRTYSTNGAPLQVTETHVVATSFFDSKSDLAKFKASQSAKVQSATVGSLSESSSGTNSVAAILGILEILKTVK